MDRLKPCPFCGSTEETTVYGTDTIIGLTVYEKPVSPLNPEATFKVHCRECGCYGGTALTKEKAIAKWNKRKEV